jgi:hypothetical protein
VDERSSSTEGELLYLLKRLLIGSDRLLSLADITDAFAAAHGREYDRPIVNRWVGAILRRLGLSLYKSNGVFVLSPGQDERIATLFRRYGITNDTRKADISGR